MLFLRHIANTSQPSGSSIETGASFSYSCMPDYQPKMDSGIVQCLGNGQLSHEIDCIPKACPEHPPNIINGRTIFHSTKHGSIAKYRCFPGYQMEPSHLSKLTCQYGEWLPKQIPSCLPSNFFITRAENDFTWSNGIILSRRSDEKNIHYILSWTFNVFFLWCHARSA